MKIAINLQYLIYIIAGFFFLCGPAMALDNYKEFKRDRWDFELASQFFYSQANYRSFGTSTESLPNDNRYQLLDVTFETRYMPKPTWSVIALGNIGNSESSDSMARRTNSSLTHAAVGFDFLIYSGNFQLVPEVLLVMPFQHIDPTSDSVLNSEGVLELRSRLVAQKDFVTWRGYGWLGLNYRGDGRSFLMPYGVGAQFKSEHTRWGGELIGYQSVSSDTKDNAALRTGYINGVNAGSLKFYSAEPSLLDSQLCFNWVLSKKWMMQVNGGMTLLGENTAAGFHVGGFVRYSFDLSEGYIAPENYVPINSEVPNYRSNMYDDNDLSSEKKVKIFREDVDDGVDQHIFKPEPTKRPRVKDSQIETDDFQVELKSKKKRRK